MPEARAVALAQMHMCVRDLHTHILAHVHAFTEKKIPQ